MTSSLRYSSSPTLTTNASYTINRTTSSPPQKKQKMSLTQTYHLAHTARAKLSKEAAKADHELHRLVGHANLLDGLMLDLAEAEREQESWFNASVRRANKASEEPKHIQWADSLPAVVEDYEEEESDSSDDESDADDEQEIGFAKSTANAPLRRVPSPPMMTVSTMEIDMGSDEEEDEDEDDEELALTRTSSRTPPELLHEEDSESDDDSMPPSPPLADLPLEAFSSKSAQKQQASSIALPVDSQVDGAFYEEGFYLPQRQAVAVY